MRSIATRSQLRAYAQSFSAVEVEIPSAAADCSAVRPPYACRRVIAGTAMIAPWLCALTTTLVPSDDFTNSAMRSLSSGIVVSV